MLTLNSWVFIWLVCVYCRLACVLVSRLGEKLMLILSHLSVFWSFAPGCHVTPWSSMMVYHGRLDVFMSKLITTRDGVFASKYYEVDRYIIGITLLNSSAGHIHTGGSGRRNEVAEEVESTKLFSLSIYLCLLSAIENRNGDLSSGPLLYCCNIAAAIKIARCDRSVSGYMSGYLSTV